MTAEQMAEDLMRNAGDLPAKDRRFVVGLDRKRDLHGRVVLTAKQKAWVRDIHERETKT